MHIAKYNEKRQDIELLRIISAFGIIWFHSSTVGRDIAYSGLIIFVILSFYLSGQSNKDSRNVMNRAKRLLIPWLVWFVFYGVINLARHKPLIPLDNGIISGVLAGPSIHLWYMPFIFITLSVFDWLKNRLTPCLIGYVCAASAILIFIMAPAWRPWSLQIGTPIAQYAHAVNGVLVGNFLAYYYAMLKPVRFALLLFILAMAAYLSILPMPGIGVPYLLGIGISAAVLLFNRFHPAGININWLSECTLGIYLIHPFCYMIIFHTKLASGLNIPLVVFLMSFLLIILLKRILPNASKYAM
ncbi:MAG: acyltransferase [Gallionella sp.]|nr:acyltransferase [Gallionella sp.]